MLAGVPVHGVCHPGMIHYFYCMPRMIPYANQAAAMIGAEIRHAVHLPKTDGTPCSDADAAGADPRVELVIERLITFAQNRHRADR